MCSYQEAAQQEGIPPLHPQLHSSKDCQKTLNVLTGGRDTVLCIVKMYRVHAAFLVNYGASLIF